MTIQQHASFDSSAAELNATSKLVKAWESKNAKNAAKAGGISLMALSLAACGGSSTTTTTATDTTTDTTATDTTTTVVVDAAKTMALTVRDDSGADFTGGSGADMFDAYTTTASLTNGDVLVGGDGIDTLAAYGIATVSPTTTGIELVELRTAAATVTMTNMSGVTDVINDQSTGTLTIAKAAAGVNLEVKGLAAIDTIWNLATATGTADALNVTVTGDNGDITADGVETVNITSGAAYGGSTGASLDLIDSNTLTTVNVTSAVAIDLGVITQGAGAAKALTLDGTNAAAGFTADVSDFNGTSAGVSSVGNTITGSASDDTIKLDAADIDKYQTISGGEGTDTLYVQTELSDATLAKADYAGITGFENLTLGLGTEAKGGTITQLSLTDAEGLAWVEKITMVADVDHDLLDVPDDFTLEVAKGVTANQVVTVSFEAGITDLTLNLMGGATLTDADITNSGVLNILSGGAAANKVTAIVGSTAPKFVITGSQSLDLNDGVLATTTLEVDGSEMTGALLVATSAKATKVTSGSGDDNVVGGAKADTISTGAGNDTILGGVESDVVDGGAGDDTITVQVHASMFDTVTTGTGADKVILEDAASTLAVAHKEVIITDFDFGTSTTTVDALDIANSMIEANDFGGTITGAFVDSNANDVAAGDGTVVHITTDGQTVSNADVVVLSQTYATAAAALAGVQTAGLDTFNFGAAIADADIMLVAYTDGTNSYIASVVADLGASVTGGNTTSNIFSNIDVLVQFSGVTDLSTLDSGDISIIA